MEGTSKKYRRMQETRNKEKICLFYHYFLLCNNYSQISCYLSFFSNSLWKCVGKLPDAHSAEIYSLHCAPVRAGHGQIVSSSGDHAIHIYCEAGTSTMDIPKLR